MEDERIELENLRKKNNANNANKSKYNFKDILYYITIFIVVVIIARVASSRFQAYEQKQQREQAEKVLQDSIQNAKLNQLISLEMCENEDFQGKSTNYVKKYVESCKCVVNYIVRVQIGEAQRQYNDYKEDGDFDVAQVVIPRIFSDKYPIYNKIYSEATKNCLK